jgi:hypothetical protein
MLTPKGTIQYFHLDLSSLPGHNAGWPYQTAFELPAQMYKGQDQDKTFKLLIDSPRLET